jgi:RNA polymerase sigma-70 factor (ECF subfamily)
MFDPHNSLTFGHDIAALRGYLLFIAERSLGQHSPDVSASDLVQATLLQAHVSGGECRANCPEQLRGWLRAILMNLIRRAARPGQTVPLDVTEVDVPAAFKDNPVELVTREERDRRLAGAVAQLPVDQRQVVQLRFEHQLPFNEIGDRLGKSPDAVRMLFNRALKRLQWLLTNLEVDP